MLSLKVIAVMMHLVTVTGAPDADTFYGDIDLGYGIVLYDQKFRLSRVDTFEARNSKAYKNLPVNEQRRRVSEGKRCKKIFQYLVEKAGNKLLVVHEHKDEDGHLEMKKGTLGRWLVETYAPWDVTFPNGGRSKNNNKTIVSDKNLWYWNVNDGLTEQGCTEVKK